MVDRRVVSPRALADSLYIPENDPAYRGYMTGPNDYADLAGAIGQASMVLPPGVGTLFSGGANALRNAAATRAAMAAPERMRMLAAPSTRVGPQSSVSPEVIYGTSAEGAPRIGYAPTQPQYRQTVNMDYGIGPKRPPEAYRPVIDETYTLPEELNRRPEVVTDPSAASRLGSESPQADQALAMAQQRMRDAEAKFVAEQQARATGEGMRERPGTDFNMVGSSYDPMGRALQPTYTGTSATAANAPRSFLNPQSNLPVLSEQGFSVPSAAQNRALALTDRSGGNLVPTVPNYLEGNFSVVHPDLAISGSNPSAIAKSNVPLLARSETPYWQQPGYRHSSNPDDVWADIYSSTHSDVHSPATVSDPIISTGSPVSGGPGAFSAMPMRPITAGGTVGAAMLARAIQQAPGEVQDIPSSYVGDANFTLPPKPAIPAGYVGDAGFTLPSKPVAQQAVQTARAQTIPAAAKPAAKPSSGGLASLFSQPLSTRQLNQQSIDNPDDPGAWMRAERQYASTHKDNPNFDLTKLDPDTGMKRGGTASGKSEKMPDPVHKALEIIHHLLMRH
jgi:hypothetical protein